MVKKAAYLDRRQAQVGKLEREFYLERRNELVGKREFRATVGIEKCEKRADGGMTISGYSAVFDSPSEPIYGMFVERIARGAFRKVINGRQDVRLLQNHDGMAFARTGNGTLRLVEDARGLHMEADLNPEDPEAVSLFAKIQRGDVNQQSFAFTVGRDEWLYGDPAAGSMDQRTIMEFDSLYEVSVVTFPAYEETSVAPAQSSSGTDVSVQPRSLDSGEQRDVIGDTDQQIPVDGPPELAVGQETEERTPALAYRARIAAIRQR